jgi:hypothetical protein
VTSEDGAHRSHEAILNVKGRLERELGVLEVDAAPLHIDSMHGSRPDIGHEWHRDHKRLSLCDRDPGSTNYSFGMLSSIAPSLIGLGSVGSRLVQSQDRSQDRVTMLRYIDRK